MGNLTTSLLSAANALRVYERGLSVVQNNVANAQTPGYAKQRLDLRALSFDPAAARPGGVAAGDLVSSRSLFAEAGVRSRQSSASRYGQLASSLSQLEPVFDISDNAGIPGALNKFFQSFAQLSVAPNDVSARQQVIDNAQGAARAIRLTVDAIRQSTSQANTDIRGTVAGINQLTQEIQEINITRRGNSATANDAGLDARLTQSLESLSQLVGIQALHEPDGSVTVLMGGEIPLVIGSRRLTINADLGGSEGEIRDENFELVTSKVTDGRLRGLLDVRNGQLGPYEKELDRLAATLTDRVNQVLSEGVDADGQTPVQTLFAYDPDSPAATIGVTVITPREIAAALPSAPGGNGNALRLAALESSPEIDDRSFAEFFGDLSAQMGRELTHARENESNQHALLNQATFFRDEISRVSLDEEAIYMIAFQRSYQATAKLLTTLSDLTEIAVGLIR